jgi:hypothetical protein
MSAVLARELALALTVVVEVVVVVREQRPVVATGWRNRLGRD